MLLSTLGASLLRDILAGKGIVGAGYGFKRSLIQGKGRIKAGYGSRDLQFKKNFQFHPIL